ncbi:MAG: YggT family protein [Anaerolineae bacterium]|nr:YggT family protein [Anaerolineae bacterium]MCB0247028.1 YggT family protein [Anaerolineae bacterium]
MGNFLFQFIDLLLQALTWLILIRVLITWIPNLDPFNPIVRLLRQATDPILEPARRIIPPIGGMDISPIVVILILQGLQMLLRRLA